MIKPNSKQAKRWSFTGRQETLELIRFSWPVARVCEPSPLLWRQPLLSGTIYGLLVYGVMNYIVLPISAAGLGSKDPLWIGLSILVHMFLIGVPRAVFARRAVLARQFAS